MMTLSRRFASLTVAAAFGAALSVVAVDADARISRGGSFGSRGSRSFTAPPAPQAAPRAPTANAQQQAVRPPVAPAAARPGGFLNRGGLMGGLAAGFLGAGLFGMLSGNGLFGGLGGLSSILGLLLQVGIVFFVGRWLFRMWQRRGAATPAYAGGPAAGPDRSPMTPSSVPSSGSSGYGSPGYGATGYAPPPQSAPDRSPSPAGMFDSERDKIGLGQPDLDAFERLLGNVQAAYGRQDRETLSRLVTPEVLDFMEGDLRSDAEQGVVNRIGNVKLLDGDLSEAWREGDIDYATVAMRYAIEDVTLRRDTGEVVDRGPAEVTEYWTFARPQGGDWLLSAVQPVD